MTQPRKVFITNATAYSIAYMCKTFLNESFTKEQIIGLRAKYSLQNITEGKFDLDELLSEFTNESIYFVNLFLYLKEGNRIDRFLKERESITNFEFDSLFRIYKRRIFHTYKDCFYLQQDFSNEETEHKNTGVFGKAISDKKIYTLNKKYLAKLGMTQCKDCYQKEVANFFSTLTQRQQIELLTINTLQDIHKEKLASLNALSKIELLELGLNEVVRILNKK